MNKIQRKRLVQLISKLEALPDEKLDLIGWTSTNARIAHKRDDQQIKNRLQYECGTTACIAGWLPVWFPKAWHWHGIVNIPTLNNASGLVEDMMSTYFGGTVEAWSNIIYLSKYDGISSSQIKAAAIQRIKNILENHE